MHITTHQARRWASIFPSHPAGWLTVAGLIVAVLAARTPPRRSPAMVDPAAATQSAAFARRAARPHQYAWLSRKSRAAYQSLDERFPPPGAFKVVAAAPGSFGDWLRHLPVMPDGSAVLNGHGQSVRTNDPAIAAVIDLHPTYRGLLIAPNMATRLRAEYLWASGRMAEAVFSFTSGEEFPWTRFAAGERPIVEGRNVAWKSPRPAMAKAPDRTRDEPGAPAESTSASPAYNNGRRERAKRPAAHDDFSEAMNSANEQLAQRNGAPRVMFDLYLESLLPYASAISLDHDTQPARGEVQPGDVFVIGVQRGHAIIVLDVAYSAAGERLALFAEGFTPAQSLHVLRDSGGSAWFKLDRTTPLHIRTWPTPIPWTKWRRWAE